MIRLDNLALKQATRARERDLGGPGMDLKQDCRGVHQTLSCKDHESIQRKVVRASGLHSLPTLRKKQSNQDKKERPCQMGLCRPT